MMAERFRGFLPVVVDVETGGFNAATDALLEIAAVMTDMHRTVRCDRGDLPLPRSSLLPAANIEPASLEVNGIDPHHPLRPAVPEKDAPSAFSRSAPGRS